MAVYGTVEELKIRVQIQKALTAEQVVMFESLLESASRNIDRVCRRPEGFVSPDAASEKYYAAEGQPYLRIDECMFISEVAVKSSLSAVTYTAWTTPTTPMAGDGDWIPCTGNPNSPVFGQQPYDLLLVDSNGSYTIFLNGGRAPVVKITALWGPSLEVPADIQEACLMQAARWQKEFAGALDSRLSSVELGQITYRRGLSSSVRQILEEGGWIIPLYGR